MAILESYYRPIDWTNIFPIENNYLGGESDNGITVTYINMNTHIFMKLNSIILPT